MNKQDFIKSIEESYKTALDIVRKKNADYSEENNPFSNFEIQGWLTGCTVEQAIMGDIARKMARIKQLVINNKSPQVNDEAIADTLLDMSNYLMILKTYLEEK
jgi:hypothetical protein